MGSLLARNSQWQMLVVSPVSPVSRTQFKGRLHAMQWRPWIDWMRRPHPQRMAMKNWLNMYVCMYIYIHIGSSPAINGSWPSKNKDIAWYSWEIGWFYSLVVGFVFLKNCIVSSLEWWFQLTHIGSVGWLSPLSWPNGNLLKIGCTDENPAEMSISILWFARSWCWPSVKCWAPMSQQWLSPRHQNQAMWSLFHPLPRPFSGTFWVQGASGTVLSRPWIEDGVTPRPRFHVWLRRTQLALEDRLKIATRRSSPKNNLGLTAMFVECSRAWWM